MQNKVPEGFETDDKLDVSLRPSEVIKKKIFVVVDVLITDRFFFFCRSRNICKKFDFVFLLAVFINEIRSMTNV